MARRHLPYAPPCRSARTYLRLPHRHIGLFRFLLEAHGHLGLASALDLHARPLRAAPDERAAVLRLLHSPDQTAEVAAFLDDIAERIPHERLPAP